MKAHLAWLATPILLVAGAGCSSSESRSPQDDAGTHSDAGSPGLDGGTPSSPTATALLAKLAACSSTPIHTGFSLDDGTPATISISQCGTAAFWKADMDVDCDGIQSPPCNTDVTGQPQTSIVDAAPNGDVDPTLLPYYVIPLGNPETTWYKNFGIDLGQVGAVIYKDQVRYGIFADEAGGSFIGEASYAMCQLFLGPTQSTDPCDPNNGGIDPADVTYITFTGTTSRAQGADIYDHDKHTAMGTAAAAAWLSAR